MSGYFPCQQRGREQRNQHYPGLQSLAIPLRNGLYLQKRQPVPVTLYEVTGNEVLAGNL